MKKRLILEDEKSAKFWEIEVAGGSHQVRFGKIGAKGQTKRKEFDSESEALRMEVVQMTDTDATIGSAEALVAVANHCADT